MAAGAVPPSGSRSTRTRTRRGRPAIRYWIVSVAPGAIDAGETVKAVAARRGVGANSAPPVWAEAGAAATRAATSARSADGRRTRRRFGPLVDALNACTASFNASPVICHTGYMASTFDVLAEPTRRRILDLLRDEERPVNELVRGLDISQPGVSKHLKVLREAGLVEVRQDAQRRLYRVRAEPLAEIDAWLAPYRRLWAGTLDALERHLDAKEDR